MPVSESFVSGFKSVVEALVKQADAPGKGVHDPFYTPGEYDPALHPRSQAVENDPGFGPVARFGSNAEKHWQGFVNTGVMPTADKSWLTKYIIDMDRSKPENKPLFDALISGIKAHKDVIDDTQHGVAAKHLAGSEGFEGTAYKPLPNSNWTYGYGFEYKPDENWHMSDQRVQEGDTISEEDAKKYLSQLTKDKLEHVKKVLGNKTYNRLDYGQRAALASVDYNVGGGLKSKWNLVKDLKNGLNFNEVAGRSMPSISGKYIDGVKHTIRGLVNRRLRDLAAAGVPAENVVLGQAETAVNPDSYKSVQDNVKKLTGNDTFDF